jgi:hypothetical protein
MLEFKPLPLAENEERLIALLSDQQETEKRFPVKIISVFPMHFLRMSAILVVLQRTSG